MVGITFEAAPGRGDRTGQPVGRIVVIGAGIAGLAAANALAHAGREVVVLEARERIGGRLHTVSLPQGPVDLGGSWIHTPDGNPLARLADHLGVARRPGTFWPTAIGWDPARGRVPDETLRRIVALATGRLFQDVPALATGLPPGAALDHAVDAFASREAAAFPAHEAAWLRSLVHTMASQDGGAPPSEVGAHGFPVAELEYGGDPLGDLPGGGYAALLEPLARGLDIRLAAPVVGVEVRTDGVRVRTSDGTPHEGSHALVTVPLGVLRAGAIAFDPPLDPARRRALEAVRMGRFEKVVLGFREAFWAGAGVPAVLPLRSDGERDIGVVIGLDAVLGIPAVAALAIADAAPLFADESGPRADAPDRVIGLLASATGRRVEPETVVASTWSADPWSRGAYAHVAPGGRRDAFEVLGEPHAGRVLFAGEATGAARTGYADGAFSTGVREAARLLRTPRVTLGPIPADGR